MGAVLVSGGRLLLAGVAAITHEGERVHGTAHVFDAGDQGGVARCITVGGEG